MSNRLARLLLPVYALLLVACWLGVLPAAAGGSELRQTPFVKALARVRPSVVSIRGEKKVPTANQQSSGRVEESRRVNGMGTGVVIDRRGYVLTNHHVVNDVREIQVTLNNGQEHNAKLIRRDPETDLAIIKIDTAEQLQVVPTGTSADLMWGEPVVAVGNAYGYDGSVTRGIISALHRAVQVSDAQFYEDLIQTDASINPGNSGGPLLNIDGQMIGINVAVRAGAQGIGFAIPVDKAMAAAAELLASLNLETAWHGVVLDTDSSRSEGGLVVESLEKNGPGVEAGLEPGDLITAVGDIKIERPLDFHRALLECDPGEEIELSLQRNGESLNFSLTLAKVPKHLKSPADSVLQLLGMELTPIPSQQFHERFDTHYRGGLAVTSVRSDSPAARQGICKADVLVGMHKWETISLENVVYILGHPDVAKHNPIKFWILRGSETRYGYLPLSMRESQQPH